MDRLVCPFVCRAHVRFSTVGKRRENVLMCYRLVCRPFWGSMAFSQAFKSFEALGPCKFHRLFCRPFYRLLCRAFIFFGGLAGPARQGEARGDSEKKGGEGG